MFPEKLILFFILASFDVTAFPALFLLWCDFLGVFVALEFDLSVTPSSVDWEETSDTTDSEKKSTLCGSRKHPYPHHRGSLEIPRERGVLKAKIFKGMYEPKPEFLEGLRVPNEKKKENPLWGKYGYFLE